MNFYTLVSSTLKAKDGVIVRDVSRLKKHVKCNKLAHDSFMSKAMRKVHGIIN